MSTAGITVLRRDGVVAGNQPEIPSFFFASGARLKIYFHNAESTPIFANGLQERQAYHLECSHRCTLVSSEVSHLIATMVSRMSRIPKKR